MKIQKIVKKDINQVYMQALVTAVMQVMLQVKSQA